MQSISKKDKKEKNVGEAKKNMSLKKGVRGHCDGYGSLGL